MEPDEKAAPADEITDDDLDDVSGGAVVAAAVTPPVAPGAHSAQF